MGPRFPSLAAALLGAVSLCRASELPGPFIIFKTEPTFSPSNINITYRTDDPSLLEPGYTFIAPHVGMDGYGPQIIDQDGNLVWYGNPSVTQIKNKSVYGMNFYVCDFLGHKMNHLCYSEARPPGAEDQGIKQGGANRILNNAYERVVDDFLEMGNLTHPNPHEFNILPGGNTFVQSVYQKKPMDLRAYNGVQDGWVWDGCIQEIDIHTRSELFQWCFLDHYPIHETFLYLNIPENKVNVSSKTSGRGFEGDAWDFMHLNAVDKNDEGDYLVSGRHLSQLLKIAGPHSASGKPPGTTLWRLNGRHSDFDVLEGARFARQHHARFVSTGQNETVVSLFNNAFNNSLTVGDRSNAMVLRLNNESWVATLDHVYMQPSPHLSYAQGSISVLPGDKGTVQVGWGTYPEWSEFATDGTLLYHAETWADMTQTNKKLTNYRTFKFPWVGQPRYPPKLVAYSQTCKSAPVAYVSWNGATEVGSWRFYLSDTRLGPRTYVDQVDKVGFETMAKLPLDGFANDFAMWVTAEAIDKTNGTILGQVTSKTFVPPPLIQNSCDSYGCSSPERFEYDIATSDSCSPGPKKAPASHHKIPIHVPHLSDLPDVSEFKVLDFKWPILILIIVAVESWTMILRRLFQRLLCRRSSRTTAPGGYNSVSLG